MQWVAACLLSVALGSPLAASARAGPGPAGPRPAPRLVSANVADYLGSADFRYERLRQRILGLAEEVKEKLGVLDAHAEALRAVSEALRRLADEDEDP
jgi:hypothetical protein